MMYKMKMMTRFVPVLLLPVMATILFAGCSDRKTPPSEPASSNDSALLPDSDFTGATIYLYDRGQVTAEIDADEIIKFEKQDSTVAYNLDISILDSLGQVSTTIVGDSGIIREGRHHLSIYGNVVVNNIDSLTLETDHLFWNSRTDKIQTDAFVKITQGEDVMTGWGLEAAQNLFPFKILKQVSGTIHDAEKIQDNQ